MGEAILVLFGLALGGYLLVAPLVAFVFAVRADRRSDVLLARIHALEYRLAELSAERRRDALLSAPRDARSASAAQPASMAVARVEAPPAGPAVLQAPPAAPAPPASATAEQAPARAPVAPPGAGGQGEPAVAPPAAAPPSRAPVVDRPSIEERFGLTWLTRTGAAAFLIGALFFFKYAVDSAWIGPTGRIAAGGAAGALLLAVAEVIREKTRRRFVHALIGVGLATLFAAVWASAVLYQLTTIAAAFAADTALLLLGAAFAFRHRGEAILILTLVAGFLNPVLLSTGQDRPLVLFSYLLLVTSVVLAVSARLGFRVVPWLALAGNAALFCGWYSRHFDASDQREAAWMDQPTGALVGPYFTLASRAAPLAFVALAALQSIGLALGLHGSPPAPILRARGAATDSAAGAATAYGVALAVSALVLAHAGAAMLLVGAPRALGVAVIALGLAAALALRALRATAWLIAPMGSAFVAFVGAAVPEPSRAEVVALLGLWTIIYLGGWLLPGKEKGEPGRAEGVGPARAVDRRTAIACAGGVGLFACLAAVLLVRVQPALLALVLAGASSIVAILASRSRLPALLLAGAIAPAGALAAAAPGALASVPPARIPAAFLGAAGLWALVHLGAVAAGAPRRTRGVHRADPSSTGVPAISWAAVLTASVATLGFVAASLGATPEDTPTLRALLTAAAGALDLALGAALLRAGRAARSGDRIAVLLGQALALFAAALAFGLGGATVTVLWAILAAIAATIAARSGERAWIAVSALLFLAALTRALGVDLVATEELVRSWFDTRGRDGQMAEPLLFNARNYAFFGVAAAMLAAGRVLSRPAPAARRSHTDYRAAAAVAAGTGYALLLATVVLEVRRAMTALPKAPPIPLDEAEFAELVAEHDAMIAAQQGSLSMTTTLVLAVAAIALLTAGFAARDAFHRYAGLCLFVVAIAKVAVWDVWRIERIYQIALFTGVGALLIGGGFLYARFGRRLVAIMRDGSPGKPGAAPAPPLAGLLVLLAACGAARTAGAQGAAALPAGKHATSHVIEGVERPGDHRLDVGFDLYRESLSGELLADVRIAGPDGAEVPYLVREIGGASRTDRVPATLLDPGVDAAGATHATWALDALGTHHCRVVLSVVGETFLREVRVETGSDATSMSVVARGAHVYRIGPAKAGQADPLSPSAGGVIEQLGVTYPVSRAALVRVTLAPPPGATPQRPAAEVRITGGSVSCTPPASVAPVHSVPLSVVETRRDADAKTTVLTLDAGADGVPLQAIDLDVSTGEFSRNVDVASTTYRAVWPSAGSGIIYRIRPGGEGGDPSRGGAGVTLAQTRIPLSPTRKRWLRLTVHDGDSAPLILTSVTGEARAREVVFRAEQPGPHRLYVGDPRGEPPRYDLADILDHAQRDPPPSPARLGPPQQNPAFGSELVARDLPLTERHRTRIGIALVVGLLGLSFWAVRMLRQPAEPGGPGTSDRPPPM